MKSIVRIATSGVFVALLLLQANLAPAQSLGGTAATKDNLDLPFDALGVGEEEEDAPEVITFYGQQYEGDAFVYIIDKSGSMLDRGELEIAKRETIKNVSEFSNKVQFGIVFFDANVSTFPANRQPAEASAGMKQAAISYIKRTLGGPGTCCMPALAAAFQIINQASSKRKVIVYLSDGGGTCPGNDEATYLKQALGMANSQNYQHVQINTIGVLDMPPLNENFMRSLARNNGGTYTRVNH